MDRNYGNSRNTGNSGRPTAYIDGACRNNGRSDANAGYGVHWSGGNLPQVSDTISGRQTNQRAELTGARRAIETARDNGYREVTIRTDSEYVRNAPNWTNNWEQNGWRGANGGEVTNRQDFMDLRDASRGMDVRYEKVSRDENRAADRLAKDAAGVRRK